jgi:hypothetical protein
VPPIELWLYAFAWTIALEVPIVVVGCHRALGGILRAVGVGLALQALTHPALWYLAPRFEPYALWLAVMETLVIITEALVLTVALRIAGCSISKAVALASITSLIANLISTLVGLWIL